MKQKLTPWFPADVKPVHVGVYETKKNSLGKGFSHWDGNEFGNQRGDPLEAECRRGYDGHQDKQWRGLAEKPN